MGVGRLFESKALRRVLTLGFTVLISGGLNFFVNRRMNLSIEAESLGKIGLFLGVLPLLGSLVNLGLHHGILRFADTTSKENVKGVFSYAFIASVALGLLLSIYFKNYYCFFSGFVVYFTSDLFYLRGRELYGQFARIKLSQLILFLVLLEIIFRVQNMPGVEDVIIAIGISYASVAILRFNPKIFVINIDRNLVNYSFPIVISEIIAFLTIYYTQFYTLNSLGPSLLTEYNVSFRVVLIFKVVSSVFILYYPPYLYRNYTANKARVRVVMYGIFIALLILAVVIIASSDPIFNSFAAIEYLNKKVFSYLMFAELFRTYASLLLIKQNFFRRSFLQTIAMAGVLVLLFLTIFYFEPTNLETIVKIQFVAGLFYLLIVCSINFLFPNEKSRFRIFPV